MRPPVWRRLALPVAAAVAAWLVPPAGLRAQPGGAAPAPGGLPALSAVTGRCGVCHPAERVQFEHSRHAREDIRCVSCHKGNDKSLTIPVAHGSGFVGRPSRREIPGLCASCHSDETRMRAYNLPVDQYALYQTSGHGRRLAQGDARVAVCSDCHGAHEILPPSDPSSSVFALNIPRMCGRCHGEQAPQAGRTGGKSVLEQYRSSVHAHALLERGNMRAPSCVSCHGVHGAAPPAVGDVDKVCGQCHTAERRYFTAGPHYEAMEGAGLPQCASCHGNHDIPAAQPERLATMCTQCHAAGSSQQRLGRKLWTEYRTAAAELEKAAALTGQAEAIPLNTEDYRARLEEAGTYLREALPAAHAVEEEVALGFTTHARSVSQEVESEIYAKFRNLRTRRIVLIVFWFYLLLTVLILRGYKRGEGKS